MTRSFLVPYCAILLSVVSVGADEPVRPNIKQLTEELTRHVADTRQFVQTAQWTRAIESMSKILEIQRTIYPPSTHPNGHEAIALAHKHLGHFSLLAGRYGDARSHAEQAVAMYRKAYPKGHADLPESLDNLAVVLVEMGSSEKAFPLFQEQLQILESKYPRSEFPDGHPSLARALNSMGVFLMKAKAHERALPYFDRVIAINRAALKRDPSPAARRALATSLMNRGLVLNDQGIRDEAVEQLKEALMLFRQVYPLDKFSDGNIEIARCQQNLSIAYSQNRNWDEAKKNRLESLNMYRKLLSRERYPNGHSELLRIISSYGGLLYDTGAWEEAVPLGLEAVAMCRTLFPKARFPNGHPYVANALMSAGYQLQAVGRLDESRRHFREALEMRFQLFRDELETAPMEYGIEVARFLNEALDAVMSTSDRSPASVEYEHRALWNCKSAVTRAEQRRQAAARAQGTAQGDLLAKLRANRQRTEALIHQLGGNPIDRDRELTRLYDERGGLERELAKSVPRMNEAIQVDALGPRDLRDLLPPDCAYVDFCRYATYVQDPKNKGRDSEKKVLRYVAFLMMRDRPVRRIDLGKADPIDDAIWSWRADIEKSRLSFWRIQLGMLLWDPIQRQLPDQVKSVYLAPDGDLSRTPWSALSAGKTNVLLERFEVATVPDGPFLLTWLKFPRAGNDPESIFAIGDLDYKSRWKQLAGTAAELDAVASVAPKEREIQRGDNAHSAGVARSLSRVRYAHFATHGQFKEDDLAAERRRANEAAKKLQDGQIVRQVAAKNPLAFVGLVLSGGEIMSGLSIVDLNLDKLRLVTLSACESGLGEFTGGKGAENLQMAFHIAGAENVVASLWRVNDAATAALMAKFYHELWVNKKPPIAALREAQLFIYYNPDKIPDVLGERGAPKAKEALAVKGANPQAGKRADTKLWAAFVLSGIGK